MSSIDKYVEQEAKNIDPRISVCHEGTNIVGRINGQTVFSIQDRYGYLNSRESAIISESAHRFQQEEREALERARAQQVKTELKNAIRTKLNRLNAGKTTAQMTTANFINETNSLSRQAASESFDLSVLTQQLASLSNAITQLGKNADFSYSEQIKRLNSISVKENDTLATYQSLLSRVKQIDSEIDYDISSTVRQKLSQIKAILDEISRRSSQIKHRISQLNELGVNFSSNVKISSVHDLDVLEEELHARIDEINAIKATKETAECLATIREINRTLSHKEIGPYSVENEYAVITYKNEIAEISRNVRIAYGKLKTASETSFTTCSVDEINRVTAYLDELDVLNPDDEGTYNHLKSLMDKYRKYITEDENQQRNYRDYCAKVEELKQSGASEYEIERFNPHTYESEQKSRIIQQLLEIDYDRSSRLAQQNITIAIDHFQNKGYLPIKIELGAGGEDSLACEAVFAIPGCNGVVVQVVADENGISKKLLGIQRTNGRATPTERVMEVSRKLDADEDGFDDVNRLSEAGFYVSSAVDSDTENAMNYIENNGSYSLTEEEETTYDDIHSNATPAAQQKWATNLATTTRITTTVTHCNQERATHTQQVATHYRTMRNKS